MYIKYESDADTLFKTLTVIEYLGKIGQYFANTKN